MDPEVSINPMQVTWHGGAPDDEAAWAAFRGAILDEWDEVSGDDLDEARGDWNEIVEVIGRATGEDTDTITSKLRRWASPAGSGPADEPPSPGPIDTGQADHPYPPHGRPAPPPPGG